jgi:DNA-binding winged helix-turn-helix (wHTH) protein
LRKFGIRVKLQDQPFRLLVALLERPGEVLAREDLQKLIWGDETVVDFHHGLGTAVNKVREALGDTPDNPRYIETLSRRGYRFIAPVQPIVGTAPPDGQAPKQEDGTVSTSHETPAPKPPELNTVPRVRRPSWWIAACVGVLACVPLVFPFGSGTPSTPLRYTEITWSGHVYQGQDVVERYSGIGTDGVRIYYSEMRDENLVLAYTPVTGGESQTVNLPAEIVQPVLADISRDGSKLLVRSLPLSELEGELWVVPSGGGTASRVPSGLGHAGAWLPDGHGIVFAVGRDLMITHLDGRAPKKLAALPGRPFAIRFAPDGSRLRLTILDPSTHTSSLWELSADGKNLHRLLPGWQDPPQEC